MCIALVVLAVLVLVAYWQRDRIKGWLGKLTPKGD
jgi:uncharacterized iron-regulated membrane protein